VNDLSCPSNLSLIAFGLMLRVLAAALRACPKASLWTLADPSVEFPLSIAANIQQNALYIELLRAAWDPTFQLGDTSSKDVLELLDLGPSSKPLPTQPGRPEWFAGWMIDFLISVRDLDVRGIVATSTDKGAFGESLARLVSFCLEGLQHRRFGTAFRAKAMDVGIKVSCEERGVSKWCTFASSRTHSIDIRMRRS
jgi:hypothetical protein